MKTSLPSAKLTDESHKTMFDKFHPFIKGRGMRYLVAPCFAIALVGCGEDSKTLKTREFSSKISADIDVIFPAISNDILQSCLRTASYRSLVRSTPIDSLRSLAKQNCKKETSISAASTSKLVESMHKLITSYIKSLAKISDAKDTDYSKEVTAVSSSIKSLPSLNTEDTGKTVDAASSIGEYLISFATSSSRKKTLKEKVVSTDKSLSQLVYALSTALNLGYIDSILQNERDSLDDYYGKVIKKSLVEYPRTSFNDYMEVHLNNEWILAQNQIDERKRIAIEYLSLLKRITCDHTRLRLAYEGRSDVKVEDVNTLCKDHTDGGLQGIKSSKYPISPIVRYQAGMNAAVMYSIELSKLKAKVAKTYSLKTSTSIN